jgi:DNA-binding LytR/AlgR family response regulator
MKWKCIIIDDEPAARKLLTEYISEVEFLELVGTAEHPLNASRLLRSTDFDVMFLDINMPKMSGIEFLKTISNPPVSVITTAYAEYALNGFDLNVLDYLVKPFGFERFLKACSKASEYLQLIHGQEVPKKSVDYFFVKCNGSIEKISFQELIFVEAKQNYVVLHTTTRKLLVYLTLKGIAEKLPGDIFLKIHKSSIINLEKIKSIEGNVINLGLVSATISQNLFESTMKSILKDRMIKR